jgi:hypothetical protein
MQAMIWLTRLPPRGCISGPYFRPRQLRWAHPTDSVGAIIPNNFLEVSRMNMPYHHQQTGWVMLIGFGLTFLALLIVSVLLATHVSALAALVTLFSAAAITVLLALFSSMTVEITDDKLSWYFGPRFWKNTISFVEIEDATTIRTKWYWGYASAKSRRQQDGCGSGRHGKLSHRAMSCDLLNE